MLNENLRSSFLAELEYARNDPAWNDELSSFRTKRKPAIISELLRLMESFRNQEITLKEFQVTFDKETRTKLDIMGLKGLSGAMFLNTLVKYLPDQDALCGELKSALLKPIDYKSGIQVMQAFVNFVEVEIKNGHVSKSHVQPSRIPYFLSAWWQLQDRERWPVYYSSMRGHFQQRGYWAPSGNPVQDYASFHETTLDFMESSGLDVWEIEYFCLRSTQDNLGAPEKSVSSIPAPVAETVLAGPPSDGKVEGTVHTHVQWLLAKLGKQLNLNVWIAQNDKSRTWDGETLGSYSMLKMPNLVMDPSAQKMVGLIDVIWIKGVNQVIAAFEIESTTSIFSGLLRMSDLSVLAPNTSFPIYIVAPQVRIESVKEQLRRPTFQALELHERCRFFSIEQLLDKAPAMLEWMDDPSGIEKLSGKVESVSSYDDALLVNDSLSTGT